MLLEKSRINETWLVLILITVCLMVFFFRLGARPLWDIDEGMHAVTSVEMVRNGDWITPTFNGQPFFDKPVLFNWLVAACFLVFGFTEFAARLPAAVLGSACVLVTYLLGRKMAGTRTGFLGALILATAVEFIILARTVMHDISLTFFVTLALYLFFKGYQDRPHTKRTLRLFYAALALAVLSKGPVGRALPAMVIGLYLWVQKDLHFIRQMQIGWGLIIFVLIAAPWYILISLKNPAYAGYFFITQNLGSFLSAEARHPEPFYYYIPVFFGGFFPWSCFLPLALVYTVRRRFHTAGDGPALLIIWFGVVFIFFSLASSKLSTYILPLFPAAALMVALLVNELFESRAPALHKAMGYCLFPVVVLFLAAAAYLWLRPPLQLEYDSGVKLNHIHLLAGWLTVCALAAFFFLVRKKNTAFFTSLVTMVVSALLIFIMLIVGEINPYRSTRELAREYDRLAPAGEKIVFYRRIKDSALFYTRRQARVLETEKQLRAFLASDKRVFCILNRNRLAKKRPAPYVVKRYGNNLLISNKKL
jgi:4-amino-4-deoxy-L-arabinose transferase-like glycosyltransferase